MGNESLHVMSSLLTKSVSQLLILTIFIEILGSSRRQMTADNINLVIVHPNSL